MPIALDTSAVCTTAITRSKPVSDVSHAALRPNWEREAGRLRTNARSIRPGWAGLSASMQAFYRGHDSPTAALVVPLLDHVEAFLPHGDARALVGEEAAHRDRQRGDVPRVYQ